MNESVLQRPIAMPADGQRDQAASGRARRSSAFYGYSALLLLVVLGWLVRDFDLINPEAGVGYWLGIIGGSMMLTLLLYPLRKRFRFMSRLGATL
ncbi:MAG: hypothetical protein OEW59_07355, partial [Gammaproteobacteria bacterium]|nr:hypothetical protein [Gammaproteobacteria bacterium]